MGNPQRVDYDQMYQAFSAAGANWPLARLQGAMQFLIGTEYQCDANWGAIDAIANLICGSATPDGPGDPG